jgi:aspartate kinase
MQELALAGAKVLNAQAVEFARDRGITIHARSTFQTGPGTLVRKPQQRELRVSGVALDSEILFVHGKSRDQLSQIFHAHGAWPRELWAAEGEVRAIVSLENVHGLAQLLEDLQQAGAQADDGLAQVAVVGTGVGAGRQQLERALLALLPVEASEVLVSPLRIALLIPRESARECLRKLHAEFLEKS